MPIDGPFGVGGGDGVLGLGPAQNTFGDSTTADRAAAETLRDTYATANAAWLALYNNNKSNWIRLVWDDGTVEQRRNAAGTAWEDVTNVIRGRTGDRGAKGVFRAVIYRNSATALTTAPTGGEFDVATSTLTAPADWDIAASQPAAGELSYESYAEIDPAPGGMITPTWSVPLETGQGAQGVFFIQQYQNAATNPGTPTGGSYNVGTAALTTSTGWDATPSAPGMDEETWVSRARIDPERQSGDVTPAWLYPFEHDGAIVNHVAANPAGAPTEILRKVDIGGVVLDTEPLVTPDFTTGVLRDPTVADWDNTNSRSRTIGFDGIHFLIAKRRLVSGHTAQGTWTVLGDGQAITGSIYRWRGAHYQDYLVNNPQLRDVYYDRHNHRWREYTTGATEHWRTFDTNNIFGHGNYLGYFTSELEALAHVTADDQWAIYESSSGSPALYRVSGFMAGEPDHYEYYWDVFPSSGGTPGLPTAAEIISRLQSVSGDNRLLASAIRAISDQIDVELGSNAWRTGGTGTVTGAQIVTALAALTGTDRLNATAVQAIASAIDGELGNTDWRTGGSPADGVITGIGFNRDGTVTISRSVGTDIVEDIDTNLANFVDDQRGNRVMISSPTTYDVANTRINLTVAHSMDTGDQALLIMPANIGSGTNTITMRHMTTGGNPMVELPFNDVRGDSLRPNDLESGQLYVVVRLNADYRIVEPIDTSVLRGTAATYDATAHILEVTVRQNLGDGDEVVFTTPTIPDGTTAIRFRTTDGGTQGTLLPLQDRSGHALNGIDIESDHDYAVYRVGDTAYRILTALGESHTFASRSQATIVGDVLTVQPSPPPVEILSGDTIFFEMPDTIPASTGDATVTVTGGDITGVALIDNLTTDPISLDDLTASAFYWMAYDGTNMRLMVPPTTTTPTTHPTLLFGTSADETPVAAELTITGSMGQGTVPAYSGSMHLLIARLVSEGDITSVLFSDDLSQTNQIGAFTKFGTALTIDGSDYSVWVSNQALTQTADLTIEVA